MKSAENKSSPGSAEPEEVGKHIERIKDRIIAILIDEECSIAAAEMILRGAYEKLIHVAVANAYWYQ